MTNLPPEEANPEFDDPDAQLDLSPRELDGSAPTGRRRLVPGLLLGAVIVGLGFVLLQTLGSASLFFYNADEAVQRRGELVEQRFRVQGTPFGEAISTEIDRDGRQEVGVVFPIRFEGSVIDVVHIGSPAELFQPGVPVVLEGTWVSGLPGGVDSVAQGANDGWHFASTDMVVKHDNEYRTDNEERLDDADRGGFVVETTSDSDG
jgi:cytochrome c-type biogenesis protein CcmE